MRMSGSSIFAGTFLMLGFGMFFLFLGNAVGLSASNIPRTDISGALKWWSWIYTAVTLIFSYYIGSLLATRSATVETPGSGALHGLASWGFASALFIGVGAIAGINIRSWLVSGAPDAVNWIVVAVLGVGAVAAVVGGLPGKHTARQELATEEPSGRVAA